jgi:hypothetical protein
VLSIQRGSDIFRFVAIQNELECAVRCGGWTGSSAFDGGEIAIALVSSSEMVLGLDVFLIRIVVFQLLYRQAQNPGNDPQAGRGNQQACDQQCGQRGDHLNETYDEVKYLPRHATILRRRGSILPLRKSNSDCFAALCFVPRYKPSTTDR